MNITIERTYLRNTIGHGIVYDDDYNIVYYFKTVELTWQNNEKRVSCIPEGTYKCKKRTQAHFGNHFDILNVRNRSGVKIHCANFSYQLLGCIAVGDKHIDLDHDGLMDVVNSKTTLAKLYEILPDEFELRIFSVNSEKKI